MVLSFLQQTSQELNATGTIALLLWVPATLIAFLYMKPWRAIVLANIIGYMILPHGEIYVPALPDVDRVVVIGLGCLLGVLWVRPPDPWPEMRWIDIPVLLWCSAPMISSLSNDLGLWDGISGVSKEVIRVGIPWFLARRFVHGPEESRVLVSVIVICALVHVLPVLYELRMSPQLHKMIYGQHQHSFIQTRRGGGWRPMVFMQHGLALAMFQATAALLALTLCGKTEYRRVERIVVFLILAVVTILTNSLGAIILFALGLGLWALCRGQAYGMVMVGTLLVLPLYPGARAFLGWDGQELISYFEDIDENRAR